MQVMDPVAAKPSELCFPGSIHRETGALPPLCSKTSVQLGNALINLQNSEKSTQNDAFAHPKPLESPHPCVNPPGETDRSALIHFTINWNVFIIIISKHDPEI